MRFLLKYSSKHLNVQSFIPTDRALTTLVDEKLHIIQDGQRLTVDFTSSVLYLVDCFVFSDENFYLSLRDFKIYFAEKLAGRYYTGLYCSNVLLFNGGGNLIYYDIAENEILHIDTISSTNQGIYALLSNYIIKRRTDSLSCYPLHAKEELWTLSFNELTGGTESMIFGKPISIGGLLYFYLSDGQAPSLSATLCLDPATGRVAGRWPGMAGSLQAQGQYIYAAARLSVWVLDTAVGQARHLDFAPDLEPHGLSIHWERWAVDGQKLYFVSDGPVWPTSRFGVLDLESRSLLWHGSIDSNDGINNSIQDIKACNGRVYVHGSDNTLHVFEQE